MQVVLMIEYRPVLSHAQMTLSYSTSKEHVVHDIARRLSIVSSGGYEGSIKFCLARISRISRDTIKNVSISVNTFAQMKIFIIMSMLNPQTISQSKTILTVSIIINEDAKKISFQKRIPHNNSPKGNSRKLKSFHSFNLVKDSSQKVNPIARII